MRMQDLTQPLVEASEAPLYHWADAQKVWDIFSSDVMAAYWEHIMPESNHMIYGN